MHNDNETIIRRDGKLYDFTHAGDADCDPSNAEAQILGFEPDDLSGDNSPGEHRAFQGYATLDEVAEQITDADTIFWWKSTRDVAYAHGDAAVRLAQWLRQHGPVVRG